MRLVREALSSGYAALFRFPCETLGTLVPMVLRISIRKPLMDFHCFPTVGLGVEGENCFLSASFNGKYSHSRGHEATKSEFYRAFSMLDWRVLSESLFGSFSVLYSGIEAQ